MKQYADILTRNMALVICCCMIGACTSLPNNDKTGKILEKKFEEKIKQDKAEYFNFQYDLLTPQRSHFVNNRLKYLTFRHGPEAGYVQCYFQFDNSGDSIEKYVLRKALPDYDKSSDPSRLYDTIFVFFPKQQLAEIYYADQLSGSTYRQEIFNEQLHFAGSAKTATQKAFDQKQ